MALVTEKFVFYDLPCTGGAWFREQVKAAGYGFEERGDQNLMPPPGDGEPDGRMRVTILRDPVAWLISYFHWLREFYPDSRMMRCGDMLKFRGCTRQSLRLFVGFYLTHYSGNVLRIFKGYAQGAGSVGDADHLEEWTKALLGVKHVDAMPKEALDPFSAGAGMPGDEQLVALEKERVLYQELYRGAAPLSGGIPKGVSPLGDTHAAEEGTQPEGGGGEHPDGDPSGEAAEAGGSDRAAEGGESETPPEA